MARKNNKTPLNPWETAGNPLKDRYIRPGYTLYTHPIFKKLSQLEQNVYERMVMAAAGKPVFTFPRTCYEKEYGLSKTSVQKVVKGLVAAGFIRIKESNWQLRKPNVYSFINDWKKKSLPP